MVKEFIIADQNVSLGSKVRGYLRVGPYFIHNHGYIRSFELIPITVIRGSESGLTLCQTSGCHGTEYSGIDSTIRLANDIQPEDLNGILILVHPVNVPGLWERTYINPIDGKDMQRNWPGDPYGTIAERMTFTVFNEAVLKADYFLDCHGGCVHESTLWYAIYYRTDDKIEEKSVEMIKASGLKYAARYNYRPKRAMGMEATKKGIPGFLYELGTGDRLIQEESDAVYNASQNVMKYLGMLKGEPIKIRDQPAATDDQKITIWKNEASDYFKTTGIFYGRFKPGDFFEKGDIVGEVKNLWGEVIETIQAPATGHVSLMVHNPVVRAGEEAIKIRW